MAGITPEPLAPPVQEKEWSWVKPNFINDTRLLVARDPYLVSLVWSCDIDTLFDQGRIVAWMVMPKPPSREEFDKANNDELEQRTQAILNNQNNPSTKVGL